MELEILFSLSENFIINILFLDIDGVLNSTQWYNSNSCKALDKSIKRYFDPVCIEYLNKIVNETEARIIISSSWRLLRDLQELQNIFYAVGFKGKIYGKTPISSSYDMENPIPRGLEIQEWLDDNRNKFKSSIKYAILDDEDDFLESQKPYFFQTNFNTGLDDSLAEKIISFFK